MDIQEIQDIVKNGRTMLKPDWKKFHGVETNERKGIKNLPLEKPFSPDAKLIDLIPFGETKCGDKSFPQTVLDRRSVRKYTPDPLTLEELSYLLWTTNGLKSYNEKRDMGPRAIPSAGMMHCLETYLYIDRVEGIERGIYRYLPKEQKLLEISTSSDIAEKLNHAIFGQLFGSAVIFLWTAFPSKMEHRYLTVAHKMIAMESGHVCQNLYLAADSIDCGCCAIGAYYQDEIDSVLQVDGEEEFTIYLATIGKLIKKTEE